MNEKLKAPFPYFGGKSTVAEIVWDSLGQVGRYIEPFFGSGAILLARPDFGNSETVQHEIVNDADCYLANVWRALKFKPDETAEYTDWPVNHCDLTARREWLMQNAPSIEHLQNDPEWCDPKAAGFWIWGMSCWIGGGFTSRIDGIPDGTRNKIKGTRPHIVGNRGIQSSKNVKETFEKLSNRLKNVKVVCGDWKRVCGGNWQKNGVSSCGFFFDPPYSVTDRSDCYEVEDYEVAKEVQAYCLEKGKEKGVRIVIAGYYEEHESLLSHGWTFESWTTNGGYGNMGGEDCQGKKNRFKEALFFSPNCIKKGKLNLT